MYTRDVKIIEKYYVNVIVTLETLGLKVRPKKSRDFASFTCAGKSLFITSSEPAGNCRGSQLEPLHPPYSSPGHLSAFLSLVQGAGGWDQIPSPSCAETFCSQPLADVL